MESLDQAVARLVKNALAEDLGSGDITSKAVIPAETEGHAVVLAKESLVVCGHLPASEVCQQVDAELSYQILKAEGEFVDQGTELAKLSGPVRSMLSAERTLLNFLQRLSGVATETRCLKELLGNSSTELVDTRKTTPGYRLVEKHATLVAGGKNHRMGLYDAFLIKDNHLDAVDGDLSRAVAACRAYGSEFLQVEVRDGDELEAAIQAKPDSILLDNMGPKEATEAILLIKNSAPGIIVEISGGINRNNIGSYANCGAERISSGALTHSAKAVDISLVYQRVQD